MEAPKLQPLRIISGWHVEWNLFYEVDPSEETMTYLDSSSLLHLNNNAGKVAVNLEWRPENDVNGNYILRVISLSEVKNKKGDIIYDGDWENLLFELHSKNRLEVVSEIERVLLQF
ncbi:hypothetical protein [Polaribacter septentrionalilitoris]|uniref:hypothetical protein n=1 Tax=Polaribacter septentrionalilitoris TaxID=2494657 RepID=UPI00135C84CC|nr:hypothetical protein [Polaribacter septentrionalilitoris]